MHRGKVCYGNSRLAAFTLAEVLITLGIIGVVAALTLPSLVQSYKKSMYVNSLKKAYSVLNNLTRDAMAKDEVFEFVDTNLGSAWNERWYGMETFEQELKNYFPNAIEFYGSEKTLATQYCRGAGSIEKIYECRNYYQNWLPLDHVFSSNHVCVLAADAILYCFNFNMGIIPEGEQNKGREFEGNFYGHDYGFARRIMVDVNGYKKPNQLGRDIFFFAIGGRTGKVIPDGSYLLFKDYYVDKVCKTLSNPLWVSQCTASLTDGLAKPKYEEIKKQENYCFGSKNQYEKYSWNIFCADKIISEDWKMNY